MPAMDSSIREDIISISLGRFANNVFSVVVYRGDTEGRISVIIILYMDHHCGTRYSVTETKCPANKSGKQGNTQVGIW
jgi:hypothetical protein